MCDLNLVFTHTPFFNFLTTHSHFLRLFFFHLKINCDSLFYIKNNCLVKAPLLMVPIRKNEIFLKKQQLLFIWTVPCWLEGYRCFKCVNDNRMIILQTLRPDESERIDGHVRMGNQQSTLYIYSYIIFYTIFVYA